MKLNSIWMNQSFDLPTNKKITNKWMNEWTNEATHYQIAKRTDELIVFNLHGSSAMHVSIPALRFPSTASLSIIAWSVQAAMTSS